MNESQIIRAVITFLVVGLLAPAGLWYLANRFRQPKLKVFAVAMAVIYIGAFVLSNGQAWFGWFPPDPYRTQLMGPDERGGPDSVTAEGVYPVTDPDRRHVMELTPEASRKKAAGAVTLSYEVRTPSGKVVAQGQQKLDPADDDNWATLRTEFTSPADGEHKLILEIPKPVSIVKIEIRELRR